MSAVTQCSVLAEFDLFVCEESKGGCDHYECVRERKMADEIVRLRAQLAAEIQAARWSADIGGQALDAMRGAIEVAARCLKQWDRVPSGSAT